MNKIHQGYIIYMICIICIYIYIWYLYYIYYIQYIPDIYMLPLLDHCSIVFSFLFQDASPPCEPAMAFDLIEKKNAQKFTFCSSFYVLFLDILKGHWLDHSSLQHCFVFKMQSLVHRCLDRQWHFHKAFKLTKALLFRPKPWDPFLKAFVVQKFWKLHHHTQQQLLVHF